MPVPFAAWIDRHRPRLWLSARIVAATVVTFATAHLLGFAQSYWAVLTTVIVMQSSVGGSIKATADRLVGSLGGAVWGVAVCLGVPHHDVPTLALALAVAVAPLALATAFNPAWRVAPVTALILLLTPVTQVEGPVTAAIQRMLEVGLGSLVAVAVAFLLAPARAQGNLREAAAGALQAMAELIEALMAGLSAEREPYAVEGLHVRIRGLLAQAEVAADEARRERLVILSSAADPVPLGRTLRRVHHDLLMIGRVSVAPLPAAVAEPLAAPAAAVAGSVALYLRAISEAVGHHAAPSAGLAWREAVDAFAAAVAGLRARGLTLDVSDDGVARLFSLAFAFEQLGQDLSDLGDRARDMAERP